MAQAWSGSRRLVFFVAPLLLAAQEKTKWEADFQEGADAFAAGNYSQSIESLTAALQDEQAFAPLDLRRADTAHLLAMSYQFLGRFDRAEPLYLEAQRINESNGPAGRDRLGITLDGLGQLRFEQERWKDAEDLERRAIALCGEMRGERDSCTLVAKRHLGEIYSVSGRFREAETILQQVINTARQNTSLAPQLLPVALRDEALIDVANGHYRQAELLL